ncbi:MMPL family transporter [Corynebacterium epidermidicanis]|uniref:Putative RND superfamily drug exporter n=1 Tax=Corynebacterium epidermidicanis TaxID=1050174 RepID=A0A0G3GQ74_9CORY|nr:MMPL family transporter [Corynebacterium epidermidicanis]AKK02705.1 putative RND superfamily drug exporter [Corynebacterium epidermidicanis]
MASFLYKLGKNAYLNRWRYLAIWLIILVAVGGSATAFSKNTSSSFSIPGLDSVVTQEKMKERFPDSVDPTSEPTAQIVIQAPEGKTLNDEEQKNAVNSLMGDLQAKDYLIRKEQLVSPAMAAMGMKQQLSQAKAAQGVPPDQIEADFKVLSPLSEDGRTGIASVTFDAATSMDVSSEDLADLQQTLDEPRDGITVSYGGQVMQGNNAIGGASELIGLAIAALVLMITFGSFVAAGMPLISAVVGVAVGLLGITLGTAFTDSINDMTPTLASMIGLAVGIDYALFIVSRFRSELISRIGNDLSPAELAQAIKRTSREQRAEAMGFAVGKAGSAVVFAGLTVIIALTALTIINIPFLSAMALAAAATVVIAVAVALSFLPALLGALGTKAFAGKVPAVKAPDPEDEKPTMGLKWVRRIRKHPLIHLVAGVAFLALLAIPAGNLRLAMPTDGSANLGSPARIAYDTTAEAFGPGRNAPMIALIDLADVQPEGRQEAVAKAVETFATTEGVANAQVVKTTDSLDTAQVLITPQFGATDERASETLARLREHAAAFNSETGGTYGITGATPIFDDISQRLQDVLLPYVAIVLALAFLVLMLVFRSIWVPLIAAAGFALSVAATFGVTVGFFQEGWLGLIEDPQPLLSFLPIMLIGLVFGLAMDYQVFLVTRMREGWAHGKTAGNATSNGFKHGARVVTAAALIMISVFAAFMLQDAVFIKTMGFALAVAVLFDAFVVRMMIIPATMFLLDERAWWLPSWIDKILPKVDIEGESLQRSAGIQASN